MWEEKRMHVIRNFSREAAEHSFVPDLSYDYDLSMILRSMTYCLWFHETITSWRFEKKRNEKKI